MRIDQLLYKDRIEHLIEFYGIYDGYKTGIIG